MKIICQDRPGISQDEGLQADEGRLAGAGSGSLERLLADGSVRRQVRWRAARALGDIGDEGSLCVLCQALEDESPVVRWEAASALGKVGGSLAVDALIGVLDDESYQVRKNAAQAIIRLEGVPGPGEDKLDRLTKLLPSRAEAVIDALVRTGPPARRALAIALEDGLFFVRQDAAHTLACSLKKTIEDRPEGEALLDWMNSRNFGPEEVACLYSFRTTTEDGLVKRVEYTRLDEISDLILGRRTLRLRLSSPNKSPIQARSDTRSIESISLESLGLDADEVERRGRTLVASCGRRCLAVKLGQGGGDGGRLLAEASIQEHLNLHREGLGLRSILPRPLAPDGGSYLFRLRDLPPATKAELNLASDPYAICYTVDEGYFRYLNDPSLSAEETARGLALCAWDLASLIRKGLIHDALVPIFHNRETTGTRPDLGAYRWWSMIPGRLDRWRGSCRYPNLRVSGIADFEHISFCPQISATELRHRMGDHLLSMSLVLGSYFRNRGRFDPEAMSAALKAIFGTYYRALASGRSPLDECIDWDRLATRMIEEMEGDKYMVALVRGAGPGGEDLEVKSGPHLGHFSGFFPIPELIKAIHLAALFAVLEMDSRIQKR